MREVGCESLPDIQEPLHPHANDVLQRIYGRGLDLPLSQPEAEALIGMIASDYVTDYKGTHPRYREGVRRRAQITCAYAAGQRVALLEGAKSGSCELDIDTFALDLREKYGIEDPPLLHVASVYSETVDREPRTHWQLSALLPQPAEGKLSKEEETELMRWVEAKEIARAIRQQKVETTRPLSEALLEELSRLGISAEERLLTYYAPSVARIAGRYQGRYVSRDEAIGAGMLGLAAAMRGFDPSKGPLLIQFAQKHIIGAIYSLLRERTEGTEPGQVSAMSPNILEEF